MKKQFNYKSNLLLILSITLLVRIITVFLIGKIPCMDFSYWNEANNILNGSSKQPIYLVPSYGFLLYFLNKVLGSLFLASSICYVLFSFCIALLMYLIAKVMFNERTATITLLLITFMPNLTVAVAGYSHTSTVSLAFILSALYVLILGNFSKMKLTSCIIYFTVSSALAIFIRPESIIIIISILLLTILNKDLKLINRLKIILISSVLLFTAIKGHQIWIKHNTNSQYAGTFSDNKYTYLTFMHTLSLKNGTGIVDSIALDLSIKSFGSPESNRWSTIKAISKNPKIFVSNILYNIKELLDSCAHPLFYPFYLYFFIGIGIFSIWNKKNRYLQLLPLILLFSSIIPVLVFHVEIRYLVNFLVSIILISSYGLAEMNDLGKTKITLALLIFANFIIYAVYLINNSKLESLCG